MKESVLSGVGIVAIGRNEGERLVRCLRSVVGSAQWVVYVDSGSTDGSLSKARELGVSVVGLDMTIPFTAARARNEGLSALRALAPQLRFVQFVDGDCEVVEGWLEAAVHFLESRAEVGAVFGRRRELNRERSVYNMLCDIEWDTPVGEAKACGGDVMMRLEARQAVGGYRPDLIAGEEPELCVRLRAAGWRVWRLDREMTLHDAAMSEFTQWWKRMLRAGYAFAEGAHLHGAPPERHWVRESRSIWFWGVGVPAVAATAVAAMGAWGLSVLAVYPLQVARLALRQARPLPENWWQAAFLVLAKFPQLIGQTKFLVHRYRGVHGRLIEYK